MSGSENRARLTVDHAGNVYSLFPGDTLSFGREADLVIDTNPYLHRRVGEFRYSSGCWWLYNTGSTVMLEVADSVSSSRMSIAPGAAVPMAFPRCLIRFVVGVAAYELSLAVDGIPSPNLDSEPDGSSTMTPSTVALNEEQYLLLLALAEPRLRNPLAPRDAIPTNRRAAERLGWSMPKFNRKLDNLCTKFSKLGVAGLKGDLGGLAVNRREVLVDYVLRTRRVNGDDLYLLDANRPGS